MERINGWAPHGWEAAFPTSTNANARRIVKRTFSDGIYEVALLLESGDMVSVAAYLPTENQSFQSFIFSLPDFQDAFDAPHPAYALTDAVIDYHFPPVTYTPKEG